ncbi:MAG: hypothetical protein HC825_00855 [Oscillatoriales cyanobacterium RM1_1_9]|nr:hypothetical protein [Oscillatoriales cyanobacterium SM2_3_0]NJO44779.1 hypothetical protein [Oscillatoriales cyanobacterium RM2_1_1]NJO70643.1 hypothetical protein [Oscillatoriales cyanobacterium RM1_1_9]
MTKADLEGLVKELKADLAMALESQQAVQEQLTNLQTQLEEKDQLITNLKEGIATQTAAQEKQHHELEDKLQGRLQNAEAAALKLSQTNTELAQELTTLKQENKNSKSTSQPLSRPLVPMAQPLVQKPASLALADSKRLMKPQIIHRPQHVNTQPGEPEDFAKSAWLL